MERLIAECNLTPIQFVGALHDLYYTDESVKFQVEILLSIADNENFVAMMKRFSKTEIEIGDEDY